MIEYSLGSLAVLVIGWGLKKIPNEKIKSFVGSVCYSVGVTVTLGLAKWKITKPVWNSTVEPYLIDLVDNVLVTGIKRFVDGMKSD